MEKEDYKLKLAVVSGAYHALKFRDKNPNATHEKVIQYITDEAETIIDKIDEEF